MSGVGELTPALEVLYFEMDTPLEWHDLHTYAGEEPDRDDPRLGVLATVRARHPPASIARPAANGRRSRS